MEWDVTLSFAGEDRDLVEEIAEALRARSVRVFYDRFQKANLWGKNLYQHLARIYSGEARFCVVFVSRAYASKLWPNHELEAAQERAFRESEEYLLPYFIDPDVTLPGLPGTRGRLSVVDTPPDELVNIICQKLGVPDDSSARGTITLRWENPDLLTFGSSTAVSMLFQRVPLLWQADLFHGYVHNLVLSLLRAARQDEEGRTYWTRGSDRVFDRYHVTSSVLTALGQVGLPLKQGRLQGAIDYLKTADPANVDDRAATIFLLTAGELTEAQVVCFVKELKQLQIVDPGSAAYKSLLLPQDPIGDHRQMRHWEPVYHSGGASFHACHLSDALLHVPSSMPQARAEATSLLLDLREFLAQQFVRHDGWVVGLRGDRVPYVLYAYALCPALSIPLPGNWQDVVTGSLELATSPFADTMGTYFTTMNLCYAARTNMAPALTNRALLHFAGTLRELPGIDSGELEASRFGLLETAALLRALTYGLSLANPTHVMVMHQAALEAAHDSEML